MIWQITPLLLPLIFISITTSYLFGSITYTLIKKYIKIDHYESLENFLFKVVIGYGTIMYIMLFLSILKIAFPYVIYFVTLLVLVTFLALHWSDIKKFPHLVEKNTKKDFLLVFFLAISYIFYFSPIFICNIPNYPGGDDKAYIFTTYTIISQGGISLTINYPYATFHGHLLVPGFSFLAVFFYNIFNALAIPLSLPALHLFLILHFRSLTPFTIYMVAKKFTNNRGYSYSTLLAAIFLYQSQLLFFYWGGIGESIGYLLVLILFTIDYDLVNYIITAEKYWTTYFKILILRLFFLILIALCHLYSLILFVFLSTFANIFLITKKNDKKKVLAALQYVLVYITLSLFIVLLLETHILAARYEEALITLFSWRTKDILKHSHQLLHSKPFLIIPKNASLLKILEQLVFVVYTYWGGYSPIMIICGYTLISVLKDNTKDPNLSLFLKSMGITFVSLFIFSQNSPFSIFYIPYVGANQIFIVRLYYPLEIPLLFFKSTFIYGIYRASKILYPSIKESSHYRKILKNLTLHIKKPKAFIITYTISLIFICCLFIGPLFFGTMFPSPQNSYQSYINSTQESVITKFDIEAFNWIKLNTEPSAIFFVNPSDAGPYIYIITGRIVLPTYALRLWANETTEKTFNYICNQLCSGNITKELLTKLAMFNVSYIYIGAKTQYNDPSFNHTALEASPYFKLIYKNGPVRIFRTNYTL